MSDPFNCNWVGVGDGTDPCRNKDYPPSTDNYIINKKFNTPVASAVVGGVITRLLYGETKYINMPIIGKVTPAYGIAFYIAAGTMLAEYLEKHNIIWFCHFGYRRFGLEVASPLYSGLVAQGLTYLGGNDLGLDPLFIGVPASHIGKYIANTIINPSDFYKDNHPGGLIPTLKADS
jgi:hypothetical protein